MGKVKINKEWKKIGRPNQGREDGKVPTWLLQCLQRLAHSGLRVQSLIIITVLPREYRCKWFAPTSPVSRKLFAFSNEWKYSGTITPRDQREKPVRGASVRWGRKLSHTPCRELPLPTVLVTSGMLGALQPSYLDTCPPKFHSKHKN